MRFISHLRSAAPLTVVVLATLTVLSAPVRAQFVTFTDVANSTSSEFGTIFSVGVNSSGTVAFWANRDIGGQGIYKATDTSSFTTVALDTSPEFINFGTPIGINDSGLVAFLAGRDAGGVGIYKATNTSSFTTVALTDSPEFSFFGDRLAINASGTVTFLANRDAGGQGIYKATDSSGFTTVALDASPEFSLLDAPVLNASGTVAFAAQRDAGGSGIYTATDSSSFTAIARETSPEFSDLASSIAGRASINDSGLVAFLAGRDAGGSGIYTATSISGFTTIALTTDPEFDFLFGPSVNNLGTVVFGATRDAGGSGIYAKLSSAANPFAIIRTGDALFGSTVTSFSFDRGLAQSSDIVAFRYTLANGVSGVARASISTTATAPEPSALALLTLGTIVGAIVARRRRA